MAVLQFPAQQSETFRTYTVINDRGHMMIDFTHFQRCRVQQFSSKPQKVSPLILSYRLKIYIMFCIGGNM